MCGIIGVTSNRLAAPILIEGLRRLEYRGYDSAGVAVLLNGHIERRRAQGKLENLIEVLEREPLPGTTGIGHTRWATHGAPTEHNAHPHGTSRVSVVHNGIIENYLELRNELRGDGQNFTTDTDTEVIAQLVDCYMRRGQDPLAAAEKTFRRLEGTYAIAMIFAGHPELIVGARRGPPLAVGIGDQEMFIGSDAVALAPFTRRIIYLDDGDWVVVGRHDTHFFGGDGRSVVRVPKVAGAVATAADKGSFRHFMEKELHEHPKAINETLCRLVDPSTLSTVLPELPFNLDQIARVSISGCGSAFYAGLVGRWWLEGLARVPTDGDVASEFRYRCPPLLPNSLGLLVSQSGETADTLAALRYMRGEKQYVISVVNVQESSISRESDAVLQTAAGPEIGVASTKTFTAQLSALACLAVAMGRVRGLIDRGEETRLIGTLFRLPGLVASILENNDAIHAVAALLAPARDVLYLGRGNCFPIALEGALKLKEISYIHAEGYAAGEMKHGSIALIEPAVPVIGLVPSGYLFEKTASNLQEAAARGAHIIVFSDEVGVERLKGIATASVVLPDSDPFAVPFLYAVAVQMLAYQVAVLKGRDVDCPRNLAKSVTVE